MEIRLEFTFDAAHFFADKPPEHIYRRVHGHSFRAVVGVTGVPDPVSGFVVDFAELDAAIAAVRDTLDHSLLNEDEGLTSPRLENLAEWIWGRQNPQYSQLSRVELHRDSRGQSCIYTGA